MHIGSMYPFKLRLSGDRCPGVGWDSSTFSAAPLIQTWSICLHCLVNARPRDSLSNNRKRLTYNKWASATWLLAGQRAGGWGAPATCQNVNEAICAPAAPVYLQTKRTCSKEPNQHHKDREAPSQLRPARLPVCRGGRVHSLLRRSAGCKSGLTQSNKDKYFKNNNNW